MKLADLARIMDTVGINNKDTQALINGVLNIYNFLIGLTTAFFVEGLGRRILFRVSTLGMLTIFVAWTIASAEFQEKGVSAAGIAVMVLIFMFTAFYNIALSPLAVAYSVEVLPFSIRAKGMATYVFSTKAAVFVNQYGITQFPTSTCFGEWSLTDVSSQSHWSAEYRLEVLPRICCHPRYRELHRLRVVHRDERQGARGDRSAL
jgi:dipeptide/tripeptide permease